LRKAQGKRNPNDFPVCSPEFEVLEAEFLQDVLAFLGDDPNEPDRFDELASEPITESRLVSCVISTP
jgi:hypothetical protein